MEILVESRSRKTPHELSFQPVCRCLLRVESSHSPGDTLSGSYGPEVNINCLETEVDADRLNRWITLGANIGVLAGIIFLGLEIRQNTLVAKIDSANTLEQNLRSMTMSIWSNPDFARLLKVGIDGDLTDLTAVESLQLRVFYEQVLRGWQNSYYQYRAGTLDEDIWQAQKLGLENTFVMDSGLNQHWQATNFQYTEAFNAMLTSWLENPKPTNKGLLQVGSE